MMLLTLTEHVLSPLGSFSPFPIPFTVSGFSRKNMQMIVKVTHGGCASFDLTVSNN
jgi:uncharacterized membrane protein